MRQGMSSRIRAKWEAIEAYEFDFLLGWWPGKNGSPWQTWQEYLGAWSAVREYVKTAYDDENWGIPEGMTPYAELVFQRFGKAGPPEGMSYEGLQAALSEGD